MDNFLNFNQSLSQTTKIYSVKFLDLNRIIIYADSFNIFKNSNTKIILLYSRNLNELIQLENSHIPEIENIVMNSLHETKNILSEYNYLLRNSEFCKILKEFGLPGEKDEAKCNESFKINANLRSLEEQLILSHQLNQKNEFVMFLEKYINEMVKYKCYYKLIDFFVFYFKSNMKNLFNCLVILKINFNYRKIKPK